MKSITEKLGITPGPWKVIQQDDCFIEPNVCKIPNNGCYSYGHLKENSSLIAAAPEMLKSLIVFCMRCHKGEIRSKKTYSAFISIIEKATGKTWEEVKEVVENE